MNERISKLLKPIKDAWNKLSRGLKTAITAGAIGAVVIAVAAVILLNVTQYTTLYRGLSHEEAAEVLSALQEMGEPVKTKDGGTTIMVYRDKEATLRMQLAISGHPKSTPDYNLLGENVDFMTTDAERRTYEIFQAQERAQDTIKSLAGVKNAIVTIVPEKESTFVWNNDQSEATASVTISMNVGYALSPAEVSGIKRLVATSVRGLQTANVAVIDANTRQELAGSDGNNVVDIATFKLSIEKQLQADIESNMRKLLNPMFGPENATVAVKSYFDLDKRIKEIIEYTPSTEDEKGMLEGMSGEQEKVAGEDGAGGVVGTETNADLSNYVGLTDDGNAIYYRNGVEYKYLVNKMTEQITGETPIVENITASITVNRRQYELTQNETEDLIQAMANAAGISPANVSVMNIAYTIGEDIAEDTPMFNNVLVIAMAAAALLLLLGLVVVIIINRKLKKKKKVKAVPAPVPIDGEDMPNMLEDLRNVPESKEAVLKKEIRDFSNTNPEIVAQLLRTWLKGEDGDGR